MPRAEAKAIFDLITPIGTNLQRHRDYDYAQRVTK